MHSESTGAVRPAERLQSGEFYALLMWGTVGMMMMAKGLDLLIVILGLETLSICIFVLDGFHRLALPGSEVIQEGHTDRDRVIR